MAEFSPLKSNTDLNGMSKTSLYLEKYYYKNKLSEQTFTQWIKTVIIVSSHRERLGSSKKIVFK